MISKISSWFTGKKKPTFKKLTDNDKLFSKAIENDRSKVGDLD